MSHQNGVSNKPKHSDQCHIKSPGYSSTFVYLRRATEQDTVFTLVSPALECSAHKLIISRVLKNSTVKKLNGLVISTGLMR